jgi:F-type H+-transporting ATPase subunit delta
LSSQVAKRYAKALYELAVEADQYVHVHLSLHDFVELMEKNDDIRTVFLSHEVETKVKLLILDELVPKDTNQIFFNFLKVLVMKKRTPEMAQILREYERLYDIKQNRLVVNVESAVDLDQKTVDELENMTADMLKKNVHVKAKKNPDILGGLIVEMDGTIIDASLRRKLRELRKLLEKTAETI